MALWGKKDKYVDLSEKMRKKQERIESIKSDFTDSKKEETPASNPGFFSFFGGGAQGSVGSPDPSNESPEEKRKRLSKKLSDMTIKMEDLENQIYHLKQRMEVLERKQKIGY
ncbi:MAG: hypothetical protein NUV46_03455 [Nanoarchaeota archaeon]|nr:hypothetical protein [Nanoarchaeota archaeon]